MTNTIAETVAVEFARLASEPGDTPVVASVKIAGVVCQIRAPFREWKRAFEDDSGAEESHRARMRRMRRFLTHEEARIVAYVREYPRANQLAGYAWQNLPEVPPGRLVKVFWNGGCAYTVHERWISKWNPAQHVVEILARDARAIGDVDVAIRSPLLLFITERGGVTLHSCGLVHNDRAVVFFGVSGSGKSTLAELSEAQEILSDEAVVVDRPESKWLAYGTPFAGTLEYAGANQAVALAALVRLSRGNGNHIARMPPCRGLVELLKTVFLLDDSPATTHRTLQNAMALAEEVPIYELQSRPGRDVWPFLLNQLADLWN